MSEEEIKTIKDLIENAEWDIKADDKEEAREKLDREKTMRGLKREDTPILKGYQIYHNYIREHEGLDGKTPAEACGITIEGKNKWLTLIQNASSD